MRSFKDRAERTFQKTTQSTTKTNEISEERVVGTTFLKQDQLEDDTETIIIYEEDSSVTAVKKIAKIILEIVLVIALIAGIGYGIVYLLR